MEQIPTMTDGVTSLAAVLFNQIPDEIENVITSTGQALTNTDLFQLAKGVAEYVARGDYYIDNGIADTYTLAAQGSMRTPVSMTDGVHAVFTVANSNTGGGETAQLPGLASTSITKFGGAALEADDMEAGDTVMIVVVGAAFRLFNYSKVQAAVDSLGALAFKDQVDGATDVLAQSIGTTEIAPGAITLARMASNSVDSAQIIANAVGQSELASNSVTSAKIVGGAVGNSELAANAVTTGKILDGTISEADLNSDLTDFQSHKSLGQLTPVLGTTSYANTSIFSNAGGRMFRLMFDIKYDGALGDNAIKLQFYRGGVLQSGNQYWSETSYGNAFATSTNVTEMRITNTHPINGGKIQNLRGYIDVIGVVSFQRTVVSGVLNVTNDSDNGGQLIRFGGGINEDDNTDITGFRMFITGGGVFESGGLIRPYQLEAK